jgi:excisionase family DNA binding protein
MLLSRASVRPTNSNSNFLYVNRKVVLLCGQEKTLMATAIPQSPKELSGIVLTEKDVAGMLQVSVKTVHRRFMNGTIRSFKIGNKWRTLRSDVDRFMSQGYDQQ